MSIIVHQADSRTWLEEARTSELCGKIDCIITDPPYWTLDKWRNIGTTTRLGGHRDKDKQDDSKWFPTIDQNDLWECLLAMADILADNSHAYIFCDHEVMPIILNWVRESEELKPIFRYSKPLVWDKLDSGMGYHWRARHEYIVMLEKGKRRLNDLGRADVLPCKRVQGEHYPTEKPFALIQWLMENSTDKGETVLDPFCGSGVVGAVADLLERNAILVDVDDRAIAHTKARMVDRKDHLFAKE